MGRENYSEPFYVIKKSFFKIQQIKQKKIQRKITVNIKYVHLNFNSLFKVLLFVFFL